MIYNLNYFVILFTKFVQQKVFYFYDANVSPVTQMDLQIMYIYTILFTKQLLITIHVHKIQWSIKRSLLRI